MGTMRSESQRRWVWEANRSNPVRENATLTFGTDGNLVLADSDDRIVWQTNTANKGVVGFKLFSNGNMVLHDSKGKFIWQSFDHPTDTLLVGQSLKLGGATKLVSRASEKQNVDGRYSLVMEEKTLAMYYKSPNSPKPSLYFSFADLLSASSSGRLEYVRFKTGLTLAYEDGSVTLSRPTYDTSLSYIRLEIDGNFRIHTYDDDADYSAWQVTYALFSRDSWETECQLPEKCGNFGLCENNQCVACPSPNGLMLGWSKNCKPPKASCGSKALLRYYKLQGVDHFSSKYSVGEGPMKQNACSNKCTNDCKCVGYFYQTQSSRCWIAYGLNTLTKIANSTHLAYIKVSK